MNATQIHITYPQGTQLILQVFGEIRYVEVIDYAHTFGSRVNCEQLITRRMNSGQIENYLVAGLADLLVAVVNPKTGGNPDQPATTLKLMVDGVPYEVTVLTVRPGHRYMGAVGTVLVKAVDGGHQLTIPIHRLAELVVADWPADVKRSMASQRLRRLALEGKDRIQRRQQEVREQIELLEQDLAELADAAKSYPYLEDIEEMSDGDLVDALADCADFVEETGLGLDEMLDLFGDVAGTADLKARPEPCDCRHNGCVHQWGGK